MRLALILLMPMVVVVFVSIGAGLGWAGERVREQELKEWAHAHALRLTPANRAFAEHYLRTGRRLRTWCVTGGLLIPPAVQHAVRPGGRWDGSLLGLLVGALAGTLWAELSLTRPAARGTRAASLAPRELKEYMPGRIRIALWIAGAASALAWLIVPVVDRRFGDHERVVTVSGSPALWVAMVLVAPFLIEGAQRLVLRRPQPFTDPDLIAADDAVRSQSVHQLGGTGVAVLLSTLVGPLLVLATVLGGPANWVFGIAALACLIAALVFWRYYSHRAWRVDRARPAMGGSVRA